MSETINPQTTSDVVGSKPKSTFRKRLKKFYKRLKSSKVVRIIRKYSSLILWIIGLAFIILVGAYLNSTFGPTMVGWMIQAMFIMGTPLILAALGGMFSERSGVVNIALEGMMLMGAWAAAAGSHYSRNPWIGVFAAIIAGGLLGLVHALVTVKLKGNHIVSGTGIILFAAGFTTVMMAVIWGSTGSGDPVPTIPNILIPQLQGIPFLGTILWVAFGMLSPIIWIMFFMVPICWYFLFRTPFGLRLRAAGEDPSTLDTTGVNVETYRIIGVVLSGMLSGLAGSYLSIGFGSAFAKEMTTGRGFIALAALIFGNWNPLGVLIAGLFFGFLQGLQIVIQIEVPFLAPLTQFIQMIPYISVIVALGVIRRSVPPAAIGEPYVKEKQH
jgi:simple sugar transport system permease protein